jgi:hypothetical protein
VRYGIVTPVVIANPHHVEQMEAFVAVAGPSD